MNIKLVDDPKRWERFFRKLKRASFPQSWNWGRFQEGLGNKVWRVGVFEKEELVGTAQLIEQKAKRGNFIILPHGPSFLPGKEEFLPELVDYLDDLAQRNRAWFLRIAPFWLDTKKGRRQFRRLRFRPAPMYIHAERTWNLDLQPSEEELLRQMRKTTRWSIKKALKEGVRVETSGNSKDVHLYHQLEEATVKRKHFVPYSLAFEEKLFETFSPAEEIAIFKGIWRGKVLSAAVVIFWQKWAFYYLGASLLSHPKIPVSHLVQWEAILEAKRRGCQTYNFWGIAPTDNPKHPWWGITIFKRGFGGYEEKLLPTMDKVYDWRYGYTWTIEKIRRRKRRV